jgi:hypothetical protein
MMILLLVLVFVLYVTLLLQIRGGDGVDHTKLKATRPFMAGFYSQYGARATSYCTKQPTRVLSFDLYPRIEHGIAVDPLNDNPS